MAVNWRTVAEREGHQGGGYAVVAVRMRVRVRVCVRVCACVRFAWPGQYGIARTSGSYANYHPEAQILAY
jgi:hypothetical protein